MPQLENDSNELLVYMLACVDAGTADHFELKPGTTFHMTGKGLRLARRLIQRDASARARYQEHLARERATAV